MDDHPWMVIHGWSSMDDHPWMIIHGRSSMDDHPWMVFRLFSHDDDVIFDKAIIDKSSLEIISGSEVDFKKEMIGESFVINNPKATASCGCGLSFSV